MVEDITFVARTVILRKFRLSANQAINTKLGISFSSSLTVLQFSVYLAICSLSFRL